MDGSMSAPDISAALSNIPKTLRHPLLDTFRTIVRNHHESRWEPSELNGGKFCEVVYSILRGHIDSSFPRAPSKPRNMVEACKGLESGGASFPRAVRIQIPRMIIALYEIRNNRGVGHVGGDVDPNHMDARVVVEMAKWILADLIRIFHPTSISPEQASALVDSLVEEALPAVWTMSNDRRVLDPSLEPREQVLLLLYGRAATAGELFGWVEHSSFRIFKRLVECLREEGLVDFNIRTGLVTLSAIGTHEVESRLATTPGAKGEISKRGRNRQR